MFSIKIVDKIFGVRKCKYYICSIKRNIKDYSHEIEDRQKPINEKSMGILPQDYCGDRKKFGKALRYAWKEAKSNTSERKETLICNEPSAIRLLKYYESGSNGRIYFGD